MKTKHTQGRWGRNIKPASKYPIIFAGRNTHVAQVITSGISTEEAEANADLIAAAPELLTAAIAVVERWDTPLWKDAPATGNHINGLRSAVALAMGNDKSVGSTAPGDQHEKNAFNIIREALAKSYRGEPGIEEPETTIAARVSAEDMAEFIVDAFNRGWISKFNLGINEDGELL